MKLSTRIRSATEVALSRVVIAALLTAWSVLPVWACNTPVFRYAIYNWPAAPYYCFYFHHGQPAKEDQAVNKLLDKLYDADPPANVALEVVDVSKKEQFERLPEVVQKAYRSHSDGREPLHLVFSSWGVEQFAGRLDQKQLKAMLDSPMRKRLGKLFDEGNAAVLLILTGPDQQANKRAEKVAGEVLKAAAGGEIPVAGGNDFGPGQFLPERPDDTPADQQQDDSSEKLKLAVLKLARTDPAEKWLVRALLSIEPDLHEFPKDPMIFAVYGRGRAMPPYVGKGITKRNLIDCAVFLAGACSCAVKEQNPGMDLLMQWDWDATAEAMAADDPQFAGGPWGYQEFALEDAGPRSESPSPGEAEAEGGSSEDDGSEAPAPKDDASEVLAARHRAGKTADPPLAVQRSVEVPKTADVAGQSRPRPEEPSFAAAQAWKLGIGLAVGAVVVVGAGLMLVRRQRPA